MNLADDPRTLSMMGEPTFRQKGEALYRQFLTHYFYLPWNVVTGSWDYTPLLQGQWIPQQALSQGNMQSGLGALIGGLIGASNPFQGLP